MDSKCIPKDSPHSHRQPNQPAPKRLPLPANQENLMRLQGMIGNQAVQRLMVQRQVEMEEMEVPVEGGGGPVVMDEMEVPMGGSAGGSGDSIVLPEDKITPGGSESSDSIVLPEDKITPGGGSGGSESGDSIVLPEDKITPGGGSGGSSDSIVLPEDKITPGGGSGGSESGDSIVLPEDKITPGGGEQEGESGGWLENTWDKLTNW